MKENKASITIEAAPSDVWDVLTDLDSYHDWNPMFISAKGKIAEGESLHIKMRLPVRMFCGAPLSYSWSPRIIKVEPNSCLEWFAPAGVKGFIDGTHYFQLTSTQDGTVTEFTQGKRYSGWGTGLYSGFGTMEDARRGFIAMNSALQHETLRRRQLQQKQQGSGSGGIAEKTGLHGDDNANTKGTHGDSEIAQLDISDPAAVAFAIATSASTSVSAANHGKKESISATSVRERGDSEPTAFSEGTTTTTTTTPSSPAPEKPAEKRTSIIGAVSSLFTSKPASTDRLPQSSSKDDLISKAVAEESEEHLNETGDHDHNNNSDDDGENDDYDNEDDGLHEFEDPEAKKAREAKNAERIEIDLGSGDLSLGDFGI
ncbi:hypothetical protein BGZ95_011059 [Linnemannia exigua]|uniref:SRPBCC domain-containing protein n=1 Tax=Linnemannia exigua TaxID=604196 RepID=A0AAD4DAF5_9FUNG|nr:hypothetical protein BGZ95_011059 [Linnemannia exigua]